MTIFHSYFSFYYRFFPLFWSVHWSLKDNKRPSIDGIHSELLMLHLRNNFFLHPFKITHHPKRSEWLIRLQVAWWNTHDYFSQRFGKRPLHLKFTCTSAIYGSDCPLEMCLIGFDDQPQMPVSPYFTQPHPYHPPPTFALFHPSLSPFLNNWNVSCLVVFCLDFHS